MHFCSKDIPRFSGGEKKSPSDNILEFHDFIKEYGLESGTKKDDDEAGDFIQIFGSSLKERAR